MTYSPTPLDRALRSPHAPDPGVRDAVDAGARDIVRMSYIPDVETNNLDMDHAIG